MKSRLLLFTILFSLTFASAQEAPKPKQLTIESIYAEGGILGRAPESVAWSPDGKKVSFVQRDDSGENGALYYVDVTGNAKPAVLVAQEKLAEMKPPTTGKGDDRSKDNRERYSVAAYHWAPDSRHILFDSAGSLWMYDLDAHQAHMIASDKSGLGDPKFNPAGDRLAYLRDHDLYVATLDGKAKKITEGGKTDALLNGEVDWVYAEELDVRSNYFWSPDGKQIAYLQMDEAKVPTYPITDYIPTNVTLSEEKFPKPGDPNPAVRVGVVNANGGKTKWINLPATDAYIPRLGWVREGLLYAFVLNRAQNKLDLYFVDTKSGRAQVVLTETSPSWIEINDEYKFVNNGQQLLWTSWRDGHTHIYLYSVDKGSALAPLKLERQLTKGDWDVLAIDTVDEKKGVVYYSSNQEDERQRQVYAVKLTGDEPQRISKDHGFHTADFAPSNDYYVDNYSALTTPPKLSVCNLEGQCNQFWASREIKEYALLVPQFVDLKAADGVTVLHGVLLLPSEGAAIVHGKVPLINNPYGGPGVQTIWDAWHTVDLFDQYMAKRGYAILKVDNRGMSDRGEKFAAAMAHHMCELPLEDQLAAVDQVLKQFPQLDRNRLGWWGWSYGGTMTDWALEHSDLFKVGVSVAPVTDWRNYDSIYTERYMGLPKEHEADYDRTSVDLAAKQLHGRLLLVHGTSDDNVHMQNSMQFMYTLINNGIPFDVQIYPRKTHSISGGPTRIHLFHRIQKQFDDVLMPKGAAASTP